MKIDFNSIEPIEIENFKGGEGIMISHSFNDDECKIIKGILKPGASSGLHTHIGNSEILYAISGEVYFYYEGSEEIIKAGEVHYCPINHSHYMINKGKEDFIFFAVVPEHE